MKRSLILFLVTTMIATLFAAVAFASYSYSGTGWTMSGEEPENWSVERRDLNTLDGDDGYYSIINPETGKALDVKGAGVTNGTNVQLYSRNNTCAQKWQIVKNDDETYSIMSACSGLALDVAGARTTNGTNVQICEWGKHIILRKNIEISTKH